MEEIEMKCIWLWISIMGSMGVCSPLVAKPKSTSSQRAVEVASINWSTRKIRFVGKAWPQTSEEGLVSVEKRAFADGLAIAAKALHRQYAQQQDTSLEAPAPAAPQSVSQVIKRMSRSAYVYHTEYFSDGSVRVSMESRLPESVLAAPPPAPSAPLEKTTSIPMLTTEKMVLQSPVSLPTLPFYKNVEEEKVINP